MLKKSKANSNIDRNNTYFFGNCKFIILGNNDLQFLYTTAVALRLILYLKSSLA